MAPPSSSSSSSSPPTQTLGSPAAAPPHEPDPKPPSPPASDPAPEPASEQLQEEEEEEGECGFCLFMKGGGCKDAFIAWEQCVETAEKSGDNIVDKCFEVTSQLKKCMDAHADYYEPILRAEEALADSIAEDKSSVAEGKDKEEEEKGKTESAQ